MTLRKDYYERWSTKRGSAEKSYDGNTCEFYVDDVPLKKYEYEERVEEICSEDTFRILTNVAWSCEGLDWRKRRDMLFQICDLPDDKAIMAGDPRFTPLAEDMKSWPGMNRIMLCLPSTRPKALCGGIRGWIWTGAIWKMSVSSS